MFCPHCGKELQKNEWICPTCQTWISTGKRQLQAGSINPTEDNQLLDTSRVMQYNDGTCRWSYDLNVFKNPVFFITLMKVFLGVALGLTALLMLFCIFDASEDDYLPDLILSAQWLILPGIMLFLLVLSYLVYALMIGGVYRISFLIDDKKIIFLQNPVQETKVRKYMRILFVITMLLSRRGSSFSPNTLTAAGAYMMARYSGSAEFSKIKKIKVSRWLQTIYVKSGFSWIHLYCSNADDLDRIAQLLRQKTADPAA